MSWVRTALELALELFRWATGRKANKDTEKREDEKKLAERRDDGWDRSSPGRVFDDSPRK